MPESKVIKRIKLYILRSLKNTLTNLFCLHLNFICLVIDKLS